jgi:2,3-bisphosphoglycerate-independent phosphoglycerate mutase
MYKVTENPPALVVVLERVVGAEDVLRSAPADMRALAAQAEVFRLAPIEQVGVPEAAWLGIDPETVKLAPGPIVVAALGVDPPERSVHFELSLLSVDEDGLVNRPPTPPNDQEMRALAAAGARLATKRLIPVFGHRLTHGLVWEEGSLDLGTSSPVEGSPVYAHLPEGDGEPLLRQLIDDSVNLFSELELNRRRVDEGKAPFNLLWPWGQGFRHPLPNLALRRGSSVEVRSGSLRLRGLSRLVGYRHPPETEFCPGIFPPASQLSSVPRDRDAVAVLDFLPFVQHERFEAAEKYLLEVGALLTKHGGSEATPSEILCLATGPQEGVGFHYRSWAPRDSVAPFDTRVLGDTTLKLRRVWEAVAGVLGPIG